MLLEFAYQLFVILLDKLESRQTAKFEVEKFKGMKKCVQ